jgi:hypothetical protein
MARDVGGPGPLEQRDDGAAEGVLQCHRPAASHASPAATKKNQPPTRSVIRLPAHRPAAVIAAPPVSRDGGQEAGSAV